LALFIVALATPQTSAKKAAASIVGSNEMWCGSTRAELIGT